MAAQTQHWFRPYQSARPREKGVVGAGPWSHRPSPVAVSSSSRVTRSGPPGETLAARWFVRRGGLTDVDQPAKALWRSERFTFCCRADLKKRIKTAAKEDGSPIAVCIYADGPRWDLLSAAHRLGFFVSNCRTIREKDQQYHSRKRLGSTHARVTTEDHARGSIRPRFVDARP